MAAPLLGAADRSALLVVLGRARDLGLLGPGPIDQHLDRSLAFPAAWALVASEPPTSLLDLGSGGGVPGLVLACLWPATSVVLLDAGQRRAEFLVRATRELGLVDRVEIRHERAEMTGRGPYRGSFPLVTARGFGPPAVTAECGAALLAAGGYLAVAEPPGGDAARWPAAGLAALGLAPAGMVSQPATVQLLRRNGMVPERYPRRVGVPAKRPLWDP